MINTFKKNEFQVGISNNTGNTCTQIGDEVALKQKVTGMRALDKVEIVFVMPTGRTKGTS